MLLGPGWQDLLWPFQIGFLGSTAAGLGSLLLLARRRTGADLGATLCLVAAVFCSGIGVAWVAGVAVELLWQRRDWRRLWIILVPGALFAIWYAANARSQTPVVIPAFTDGARYMGSATAAAVGAIIGRNGSVGDAVAIALAILVVIALVRGRGRANRLAMAVTGGIAFWLLTLFTARSRSHRQSLPLSRRSLRPTGRGRTSCPHHGGRLRIRLIRDPLHGRPTTGRPRGRHLCSAAGGGVRGSGHMVELCRA